MPTIIQGLVALTMSLNAYVATLPQAVSPPEMIRHYASEFGVNPEKALAVAKCESNFKEDVYGDHGLAYGIYQFHVETFDRMAREFGEPLNYFSTEDQIKLATWAFSKGYQNHWTCWNMT